MRIHVYSKDASGVINHTVGLDVNMAGKIDVTGEPEKLLGWPTPAMRLAKSANGDTELFFVGTDEAGEIVAA